MKYFLVILLVVWVCSCNTKSSTQVNRAKLEQLAERSCRAVGIQKQRYRLADKIRFTNDSLGDKKNRFGAAGMQSRLKGYLRQKDSLLKVSITLADTIRMQLDSLLPYTDKKAQKRFAASLDSILKAKGCKL